MDLPYLLDGMFSKKMKRPISPINQISKFQKFEQSNIIINSTRTKNKRKNFNNNESNKIIKIN